MSNNKLSSIVSMYFGIIAVGCVAGAPVSGYFLTKIFLEARASANWPSVTGTLTRTQVLEGELGRYYTDISYTYNIGNDQFIGTRIRTSDGQYNVHNGEVQAIAGLIEGNTVTVYYNPSDPAQSVLKNGVSPEEYVLLFIPLVMLGFGVLIFWRLHKSGQLILKAQKGQSCRT